MDFLSLKRKQLQSLCKKHGIPANKTNLEMADLLTAALKVKGNSPLEEDRIEIISSDEQKKSKKVRFSPNVETREYEPSGYKVPEPVRRTRRATKFASSSLEEMENNLLPDEVGNKRGRNGKMGTLSRTNRSRAKVGTEICSVTESEIETDHLDGLKNATGDIDWDGGEVRKGERGTMRNRSKLTDSDVINGVANSYGGEAKQGARRSARNGVKSTGPELVLDEVINIDGGEAGKGARRSARNGAKQTKPELTNDGVANVDGGEIIKGARRSARHGVKFTDPEPVQDEVSNMDGGEAGKVARRSARNGEKHTNHPELVNDGVANANGGEVRKGARRRNGAKTMDSELVNDGVVDRAGGESREGVRRSVRNVAKHIDSEPVNDGKARKDAMQSARSGANFKNSELVKDEVVDKITRSKAQSAATISNFEGKEVFGATAKESKGITRATSKRKSVAQLGVATKSTLLVPNESDKRLKIVDFDEVTKVKASIETTDEIKKAQPPVANPRKSRRKTIVLNSNIVAKESALDRAMGKEEHKEKELRRSTRKASVYGGVATSVKSDEVAEMKEISQSAQKIETTSVVSEPLIVKPSPALELHASKMKQKAITGVSIMTTETAYPNISLPGVETELTISEAAGGNDNLIRHRYGGLENSKKKGKSKGKLGGTRNIDPVNVQNSVIGVEINSATNLAEAMPSTVASDSKEEETLKVAGKSVFSNEIIVLDTGNSISDGIIKGGDEHEQCQSSAECVNLVNIKETLKVAVEHDNANEDIVHDTSSFSINRDQCQSSEKYTNFFYKEETSKAEEGFEFLYENIVLETGNFISEGLEGDSDDPCQSYENFANSDNVKEKGSAVLNESSAFHAGSLFSGCQTKCGTDDEHLSSEKCADLENEEETLKIPMVLSEDNVPDTGNLDGGIQDDADDQHVPSEKCTNLENETLKVAVEPVVISEDNVPDTGNLDGVLQGGADDQHLSSEKCASPDNNSPAGMGNLISDGGVQSVADDQYQSSEKCANLDNNSPIELEFEEFQAKDLDVVISSDGFSLANHSAFGCQNSNSTGLKKMVAEEKTSTRRDEHSRRDSNGVSDDINGHSEEFDGMNILERFEDEIENNLIPENERPLQSVNSEIVTESIRYLFQETDDVDDCLTEVGTSIEGDEVASDLEWNKQDVTVDDDEHEQEVHQQKASLAVRLETIVEDAVDMCDGSNEHLNKIDRNHVEKVETVRLEKVGHGELTDEMEHVGETEPRSTSEKSNVQELPGAILHEAISSCCKFEVIEPAGIASKVDLGCTKSEVEFNYSFTQQKGKASCGGINGDMENDKVITSDIGNVEKSGEVTINSTDNPSAGDDARSHDVAIEFNGHTVTMHEEDSIENTGFVDELSFEYKTKTQPMESGKEQSLHKLDDEIAIVADTKETANTENLDSVTAFEDETFDAIGDYESEAFELNLLFQAGESVVEKLSVEEMTKFVAVDQPHAFPASVANPDERRNSCELKLLSPKETSPYLEDGNNDVHCESLSFSATKMKITTGLIQLTPKKIVDQFLIMEHEQASNQLDESLAVDTENLRDGANEHSIVVERNHMEMDRDSGLERNEHVDSTDEDQLEVEPPNCKDGFQVDCKTLHHFEKENIQDAEDKETVALGECGCHDFELSGSDSKAELEIVKENFQFVQNSDQHDIAPSVALTCEETTRFEFNGEEVNVPEGTQFDALPEFCTDEAKGGKLSNIAISKNSIDETCEKGLADSMIGDFNVRKQEASDTPKCEDTHLEVHVESTLFTDIEINLFHGNSEHDNFVPNDLSNGILIGNDLEQAMHVEQYHLDKCKLVLGDSSRCVELNQDKDEGDGKQMQFDKATNSPGGTAVIQKFINFQDDTAANSSFSAHGRVSVGSHTSNTGRIAMYGPDDILKEPTNISYYGDQSISGTEECGMDNYCRAATGNINELEEAENGGNVQTDVSDEASHDMGRAILHEMELCHSFEQQNGKTSHDDFDSQKEDGKIIASDDGRMQKCDESINNPVDNPTAGNDIRDHGEVAHKQSNVHSNALSDDNAGFSNQLLGENKTVILSLDADREHHLPKLEATPVANSKPLKGSTTDYCDSLSHETNGFELDSLFQEGESGVEKTGVNLMSMKAGKLLENTIGQLSSTRVDEEADNWRQENTINFNVQETKGEIQQFEEMPDNDATMVDQSHSFTSPDNQGAASEPADMCELKLVAPTDIFTTLDNQGVVAEEDETCELKLVAPTDICSHPETGSHKSLTMLKRTNSSGLNLTTPQKVVDLSAMKENAPNVKMEQLNSLTASRMSLRRRPLEELKQ